MKGLRMQLGGGDRRSKGRADAIAADAAHDTGLVAALVDAMADPDELVRLRAADALEKASAERPALLAPHVAAILGPVADIPQHDLRWHVAQMIPRLPLDAAQRTRAVSVLRATLRCDSRVARTLALDALVRLADGVPSLRAEAIRALRRAREHGSPAERARARLLCTRREWLAVRAGAAGISRGR